MSTLEQSPDFGMEFEMEGDFDIHAAFQEAITDIATNDEIELEEKIRRMEVVISEGSSEVYRDFIDFRMIAAQVEMFCMHAHGLDQSIRSSETLSSLIDAHKNHDDHDHHDSHKDRSLDEEDEEIDPKTGKKKKRGWFS